MSWLEASQPGPGLAPTVPEAGDCALAGTAAKPMTNTVNANGANLDFFIIEKVSEALFWSSNPAGCDDIAHSFLDGF
jgi:hypothetical protein